MNNQRFAQTKKPPVMGITILCILSILLMAGCNGMGQASTPPTPTPPLATSTPKPTKTPAPTSTITPTSTPSFPSSWNDPDVMTRVNAAFAENQGLFDAIWNGTVLVTPYTTISFVDTESINRNEWSDFIQNELNNPDSNSDYPVYEIQWNFILFHYEKLSYDGLDVLVGYFACLPDPDYYYTVEEQSAWVILPVILSVEDPATGTSISFAPRNNVFGEISSAEDISTEELSNLLDGLLETSPIIAWVGFGEVRDGNGAYSPDGFVTLMSPAQNSNYALTPEQKELFSRFIHDYYTQESYGSIDQMGLIDLYATGTAQVNATRLGYLPDWFSLAGTFDMSQYRTQP